MFAYIDQFTGPLVNTVHGRVLISNSAPRGAGCRARGTKSREGLVRRLEFDASDLRHASE